MNSICLAMAVVMPALGAGAQEAGQDLVAVEVRQVLGAEPYPNVVELASIEGQEQLQFRVTEAEADAIDLATSGVRMARPSGLDLLRSILDATELTLLGAIIKETQGRMPPLAAIWLEAPDRQFTIGARPGDAVAAALHGTVPLFVTDQLEWPEPPDADKLREFGYVSCLPKAGAPPPEVPPTTTLVAPDNRALHIQTRWLEADSIWLAMPNPHYPRTRIHSTIAQVLMTAKVPLKRLVIGDIIDQAFIGTLVLEVKGEEAEIDCRPSDGIAVALRMKAPIFVSSDSAAVLQPMPNAQPTKPPE